MEGEVNEGVSQKRIGRLVLIGIVSITVYFLISITIPGSASSNSLRVSFIDVGQGDSILLSDSTGFDILIDGGKPFAGPMVVAYIRDQSIDDIDVMVASHADSDHIGGLIDVLEAIDIPVEAVLYNGYPGDSQTWNNFANAVADNGLTLTPAQFPGNYVWGELRNMS